MSQIETLTKISAHKLRIWERRYGFIKPMRNEGNIRYYSDAQLKKLLNVGILNRNGIKISKITQMNEKEVFEKVNELINSITPKIQDEIDALIIAMIEYDEKTFDTIYNQSNQRLGFIKTITEVMYPFLNQIGLLWISSRINITQEHFISNLIRQKIITEINNLPLPLKNAPTIAQFLMENEQHEIGLLIANYIAKKAGWKILYLGYGLPSKHIEKSIIKTKPNLLQTFIISPISIADIKKISVGLNSLKGIPMLISGNTTDMLQTDNYPGLLPFKSPDDLILYLNDNFNKYKKADTTDF
jgi:DNA-binding transcriptional MerR regulator